MMDDKTKQTDIYNCDTVDFREFDEGDVVGLFRDSDENLVLDHFRPLNSSQALLCGIISRSPHTVFVMNLTLIYQHSL